MEGWTNKLALRTDGPTSRLAVWVGAAEGGRRPRWVRNTPVRPQMHWVGPLSALSAERPLLQFESALGERLVRAGFTFLSEAWLVGPGLGVAPAENISESYRWILHSLFLCVH